jgi:hypothetical protein
MTALLIICHLQRVTNERKLLESGLAWLLVQELNIIYPMKRPQKKNTYRYQFGENSFMKYFLYLRDKHGLKPGHKTQL